MPTEHPACRIELFDPARHDRIHFACGVGRLDNYLKLSARKQQKDDMTRVYVAVEEGSARVLGYHAINLGMMNVDALERRPRGFPDHGEIPVLFLGQVAVDKEQQGRGLGGILMHHVFEKACVIADVAGCHAIILDVISDGGEAEFIRRKSWYESFGFTTFASNPGRMFLAMKQMRAAIQASPGNTIPRHFENERFGFRIAAARLRSNEAAAMGLRRSPQRRFPVPPDFVNASASSSRARNAVMTR